MKQKLLALFLFLNLFLLLRYPIYAESSCSATVTPTTVTNSQQVTLVWTITNTGTEALTWVRFTLPRSAAFSNLEGSADDWNATQNNSRDTMFTGGTIDPDAASSFTTTVTTGSAPFTNVYWTVYGADTSDGSTAVVCSGIPGISSGSEGNPTATPTSTAQPTATPSPTVEPTQPVGGTQTPTPTTSSTTPAPTSGPTASLTPTGTTQTVTTSTTDTPIPSISVLARDTKAPTLTILEPTTGTVTNNQTLQIKGEATDESGIVALAININDTQQWEPITDTVGLLSPKTTFTFVTAPQKNGTYSYRVRATDGAGNQKVSSPLPIVIDRQGPTITWYTQLAKTYTAAPSLTVHIEDPAGIEAVRVTTDEHVWTPLTFSPPKTTTTDISFTLSIDDDGTYPLLIQALDTQGNITISDKKTFSLAQFGAAFGPQIVHMGSFVLPPSLGSQFIPVDTQFHYTIQTTGTTNQVRLYLTHIEDKTTTTYLFSSTKTRSVWSVPLSLPKPGVYSVVLESTSPTGETLKRERPSWVAIPRGGIRSPEGPVAGATITVFTYDELYHRYIPWDGSLYNQSNPQITIEDGGYAFSVPPGTYYLSVRAQGLNTYESEPFTLTEKAFLVSDIVLTQQLPFPFNLFKQRPQVYEKPRTFKTLVSSSDTMALETNTFAKLLAPSTSGYVVFTTPWHPDSPSLMRLVDTYTLRGKPIRVILAGASENTTSVWKGRGNWQTPVIADPRFELTTLSGAPWMPFALHLGPGNIVLNRQWDILPILRMIERGGQ